MLYPTTQERLSVSRRSQQTLLWPYSSLLPASPPWGGCGLWDPLLPIPTYKAARQAAQTAQWSDRNLARVPLRPPRYIFQPLSRAVVLGRPRPYRFVPSSFPQLHPLADVLMSGYQYTAVAPTSTYAPSSKMQLVSIFRIATLGMATPVRLFRATTHRGFMV